VSGVVVTGGASGIGAATCALLAARGARVAVLDRDEAGAVRVADAVGGVAIVADVARSDQVDRAVDEAVAALGGIWGWVNNAGVGNLRPLEDYSDAQIDLIWRVNVTGVFAALRAAVPHLRAHHEVTGRPASVVNVASVSGVRPTRGEAPYAAAKAAVVALTQSAALEWAPAVRVNCVSPGFVRTPLNEMLLGDASTREGLERRTPMGRLGTAEETAELIAFLLGDSTGYLTGQNIVLDGGSTLSSSQMDPVLEPLVDLVRQRPEPAAGDASVGGDGAGRGG
jgi:NAD(P)-dependent dehydrogenase (short-subunit alcohol dehydrogenase family)